ncbi:MAG: DUF2839 domain-containing protein [Dolichospermum sp.]
MGEAKRRKNSLGEEYGQNTARILPLVPITKTQASQFVAITTRGAWIVIGTMVVVLITIRFIGPGFGWWEIVG